MNITISEIQVLWTIGALERLAALGLLQEPPYQVSQEGIDTYIQIDEHRDKLFSSDDEMKSLLEELLKDVNGVDDKDLLEDIFMLLRDFKNDRYRLVKYAMNCVI